MDPLVAADQGQQGNGGVGEPSWQGHGKSRVNVCVAVESHLGHDWLPHATKRGAAQIRPSQLTAKQAGWAESHGLGSPFEGCRPTGFDAAAYLLANPDVAAAGVDAAQHHRQFGQREGRRLRP